MHHTLYTVHCTEEEYPALSDGWSRCGHHDEQLGPGWGGPAAIIPSRCCDMWSCCTALYPVVVHSPRPSCLPYY
eukprot:4791015-Pyramimonas_sp.AAC.1